MGRLAVLIAQIKNEGGHRQSPHKIIIQCLDYLRQVSYSVFAQITEQLAPPFRLAGWFAALLHPNK